MTDKAGRRCAEDESRATQTDIPETNQQSFGGPFTENRDQTQGQPELKDGASDGHAVQEKADQTQKAAGRRDGLSPSLDRRVRRTKRQLRQGLTTLMRQKSIKEITVRELSDLVDINRGTFYIHYRDIYDMVEQIENGIFEDFNQILNAYGPEELQDHPLPLLVDVFTYLADNADLCIAFLGEHGDIAFVEKLKEMFRSKCFNEWMRVYNKKSLNFEYFYSFIISGCIGLLQHWLSGEPREKPEQIAALIEQMILHCVHILDPAGI